MKITVGVLIIFLSIQFAYAQEDPVWQRLPNAPFVAGGRHEDGWFTDSQNGWIVNSKGEIWHTADAGFSWMLQEKISGTYLRCVTFSDSLHGWAGSIGFGAPSDTIPLYETKNGGWSWAAVDNISGPKPPGLCGMWAFDSLHIYATGRFQGPPYFLASKDGGQTWISRDMSDYATNLIDCYFFSPDSGLIIGQTGIWPENSAIILFTPDGGTSWETRYTSKVKESHSWKISFVDPDTGYVSLQGYSDSVTYLKTTDRGKSWQEITFQASRDFSAQGICFINSKTGWIGPHPQSGRIRNIYQTSDSGVNWQEADFARNINRFRMLSDTMGYAIGETVYKYTSESVTKIYQNNKTDNPSGYILIDNYPNPFNAVTNFRINLPLAAEIEISIYSIDGRLVDSIIRTKLSPGENEIQFNAHHLSSGIYLYRVTLGNQIALGKMVLLK